MGHRSDNPNSWFQLVAAGGDRLRGLSESQMLLAVGVVGVALRIIVAFLLGDDVTALPGIYDQISYDTLARQVVDGHGFTLPSDWWPATRAGQPTAHWSYLYTSYLAAVYWLGDGHPLVARLLQGIAGGVLQIWLTFRIGRRVFDARVGLAAAAVSAIYSYFLYYAGALMTETFFILAVLWTLDIATRMAVVSEGSNAAGTKLWLELGLALGTGILLRQLLLLMVPFLLLWLHTCTKACGGRGGPRSVRGIAVALAVVVAMIVPWTVRNYIAFNRFVPLNTNAGYVLFWGNHPIHGHSFIPILPPGGPTYEDLIPQEVRHLDEAALDRELLKRGVGFVFDKPGRYLRLSWSRGREYFKFWWSSESGTLSNLARVFSFGLFLPFAIGGLVLSLERSEPLAGLLIGFMALYSLLHLLTWTLVRYRLPVDAVLVVFTGVGLVWSLDRLLARFNRA